jgi:hypothetical protein
MELILENSGFGVNGKFAARETFHVPDHPGIDSEGEGDVDNSSCDFR